MRIYVVDNGGQWTHREWRVLRDLGVDAKIVPNTTPLSDLADATGIVLSGGAPRVGLNDTLGNCAEYIERAGVPILGICAGHQFIARHFGGGVAPGVTPEFGKMEITLTPEGPSSPLLQGVPERSIVWESHNDEVAQMPDGFRLLASSPSCRVQAMEHATRPIYGLQFHPEVEHTQFGRRMFQNFVDVCKR